MAVTRGHFMGLLYPLFGLWMTLPKDLKPKWIDHHLHSFLACAEWFSESSLTGSELRTSCTSGECGITKGKCFKQQVSAYIPGIFVYKKGNLVKQPMKKGSFVGVGHIQSNLVIEAKHHYLHTSPPWQLLGITEGVKFSYNHTPNYLELLREQKLNYNHTPKCVKLRSLSVHYTTW